MALHQVWLHHFQREPGLPVAAGRAVTAPDVAACLLAYVPPCLLVLVLKLGMCEISDARLLPATPDTREVCGTLSTTSFPLQSSQQPTAQHGRGKHAMQRRLSTCASSDTDTAARTTIFASALGIHHVPLVTCNRPLLHAMQ